MILAFIKLSDREGVISMWQLLISLCFLFSSCNEEKKVSETVYILPEGSSGWFYIIPKDGAREALLKEVFIFDKSKVIFSDKKVTANWQTQTFKYQKSGIFLPILEGDDDDIIYRGSNSGTVTHKEKDIRYNSFFIGKKDAYILSLKENVSIKKIREILERKAKRKAKRVSP